MYHIPGGWLTLASQRDVEIIFSDFEFGPKEHRNNYWVHSKYGLGINPSQTKSPFSSLFVWLVLSNLTGSHAVQKWRLLSLLIYRQLRTFRMTIRCFLVSSSRKGKFILAFAWLLCFISV